ncbi:hypothetical protein TA3x_000087 [Tundrisphaera sp. TA3]|uniref:hypothetical protein n=1 Tax=Tundrisphaera sp. TA3 TaxID=3435775 RepID=UPI003EC0FB37
MKLSLAGMALLALAGLVTTSACPARAQDPPGLPTTANSPGLSPVRQGLLRLPRSLSGRIRQTFPLSSLFVPYPVRSAYAGPGTPASRPRPGSRFDPGAGGPGISQFGDENFLAGALDVRTGWPFVLLDHYRPRPERLGQVWIVETRDCPQELGSDPWPALKILTFDEQGRSVQKTPADLFAAVAGRPTLVQVQGNLTTPDSAFGGLLWTHSWLRHHHSLPPDAVVIAFDWPSQRVYGQDLRDINEKGRRAFVAAHHLAVLLSAFPATSRVTLLGQSYGGRVVPSALHLLGGGELHGRKGEPTARLAARPDLRVRAVIIGAASDRHWLDPGERLDRALHGCEGLLNLYNRKDEALLLYPSLIRGDHHRALGRVGLSNADLAKLGPLAARYAEYDIHDHLGPEHTLLDAVANPDIARRIAPYAWAGDPGPQPSQADTPPRVARGIGARTLR